MSEEINNTKQQEETEDISQANKSVEFDVTMTSGVMYDYMLYHAYSTPAGILGSCIGAMLILMYAYNQKAMCLAFGIVLLLYIPAEMWLKSKKVVKLTPAYKKPLHYVIDNEGVTVSQDENSQHLEWDKFVKAASTRNTIILYSGRANASVFPRKELKDKVAPLIGTITENMDPKKVKIKW